MMRGAIVLERQSTDPKSAEAWADEPSVAETGWALPFHGRARACQLIGVGSLAAARSFDHPPGFTPVAVGNGDHALMELSFFEWRESPVGPFCSSHLGLFLSAAPRGQTAFTNRAPTAARVLAAALAVPSVLSVLSCVVGDAPHESNGSGLRARAYGRALLRMAPTHGQFAFRIRKDMLHLLCHETLDPEDSRKVVSGYSFSCPTPALKRRFLHVSPSLLTPMLLRGAASRRLRGADRSSPLFVPGRLPGENTVLFSTRSAGRQQFLDLTRAGRAAFAPLVHHRPAPERALGRLLETLDFVPSLLAWTPAFEGRVLASSTVSPSAPA
jgi:hypothetical protein